MSYHLRLTVQPSDIDDLGHANNIVYVRWVQDAAVAHSKHAGLGMAEYVACGGFFVIRRHVIDYLAPAFQGDEIEVETRVVCSTLATSERRTVIRRLGDDRVLARATTTWAFVDAKTARPVRIPDEVHRRLPVEPLTGDEPDATPLRRRMAASE